MSKLFKNFGKLEDREQINGGGLGLGLTISKTICEMLGGHIQVSSEYHVGTEFIFTIKIDPAPFTI